MFSLWSIAIEASRQREARDWFVRESAKWSVREVEAAAYCVEAAVQEQLSVFGGPGTFVADRRQAADLWEAQSQAHRAVFAVTQSRKRAKEIQRAAAGLNRQPLTICRGRRVRRVPEPDLRKVAPAYMKVRPDGAVWLGFGDGCGAIILDSLKPRHPKMYCDHCSARTGRTMNAGLVKHALARIRVHWAAR